MYNVSDAFMRDGKDMNFICKGYLAYLERGILLSWAVALEL